MYKSYLYVVVLVQIRVINKVHGTKKAHFMENTSTVRIN